MTAAPETPVLAVRELTLAAHGVGPIVERATLEIAPGEIFAVVGESGSGKTMLARAILDLLPPGIGRVGGEIRFGGRDLTHLAPREMRTIRGAGIGMVFQEPMVSLNPALTIGRQMTEGLRLHRGLSESEIRDRCLAILQRIRIDDPERCFAAYPHEFSGGMRQRIMLASVMLLKPALLIADEPTTALDTLVQQDVLELMVELAQENGAAILLISHDLALVGRYAARVAVMHRGLIVEQGSTAEILRRPRHEYTRRLLSALPERRPARDTSEDVPPLVELRSVVVDYAGRRRLFSGQTAAKRAVHDASLVIRPGETLALVGQSGSGKTTLGRAIVGLVRPSAGEVLFRGQSLLQARGAARRAMRLQCQMIFQDPYSSLDPRMKVGRILEEPLRNLPAVGTAERQDRVAAVLADVGLPADFVTRFPHELSGGQRQRIAIGRAIIGRPALVIADEPVSALDMTVQKQILELFRHLQARYGFACLFISHDLGAVEQVADRVVVMQDGRIVEEAPRDALFDSPQHPYTRQLLAATPALARLEEDGAAMEVVAARS